MINIYALENYHLRSCAQLYVDVFNEAPWNDSWSVDSAYMRLKDIVNSPHFVGVIYEEDGILKGALLGNREQWFEGMHYNLREMFVATECQGSGIGRKMLTFMEEKLKREDVRTLLLFTSRDNLTSEFYKKNGFEDYSDMAMMGKDI